jgi:L,D-peptidoglycan transpeptidase YkuD (ErfK/YbiS/YcfS/YnhG family)
VSEVPAGCAQLISVQTGAGHVATLSYWEKKDGLWMQIAGPVPAVIGCNGRAPEGAKREGDGKTPGGVFAIRSAFGVDARLQTGLDYFQVTTDDVGR